MSSGIFGVAVGAARALLQSKQEAALLSGRRTGPGVRSVRTGPVRANLSRHHPDFGCTPAEHERRKAARAAGELPFKELL